jgi:hypothetical protein
MYLESIEPSGNNVIMYRVGAICDESFSYEEGDKDLIRTIDCKLEDVVSEWNKLVIDYRKESYKNSKLGQ